jgi:RHS repeat-associated protein
VNAHPAGPASRCLAAPAVGASRFVGDPIDVVTGALVDQEIDFRLPRAALALSWVRRFDSRQLSSDRGLGLGFRHELDRELRFDIDGMTYVDAAWDSTSFPFLERDGQRSLQGTLSLERVGAMYYRVCEPDGRCYEFAFTAPNEPARLERVLELERALTLYYERVTGREQLAAVELGPLGRLRVEWSEGRIARLWLSETEPERETELATYRYDERGCLVEARNAYKHSLRYVFDEQRRLAQKTDRRGYSFQFSYDAAGRCVESRGEDGAEAVKLEYRAIERATIVTRHDAGKWLYQYNDAGTIMHILDPYEGMQSYVLDDRGRVREEVDPLGNSSIITYDARGVAVAKVDASGHRTGLPEDPTVAHPLEHRIARTPLEWDYGTLFEAPARLPVTGDPLWEVPFQVRPLLQTAEAEWGGRTRMQRNLQGLPARELREDGKARRWAFDENANVRTQVDFDGHKRAFEYTSDNHLSRETDALGRVTRYEYSPTERLTALTDGGGTRSAYVLDLKDRVVEVQRHGKVRERYVYDSADNLVEKRSGTGALLLEMTVGAGNRKVARKLGSGETQTFDYDERGQLSEARGAAGSCTFAYAFDGVRVSDLRAGRGVEHTRDFSGVRTSTVLGRFTTQVQRGRIGDVSVIDPTGRSHTFSRLGSGIYQRRFSSGAREVSQFDVQGRCLAKALYHKANDDQPWLRAFSYSGEGDLLEQRDSQRGTTRFAYDAAHRLQGVMHPNKRVDVYEYDSADNLVSLPCALLEGRTHGHNDRLELQPGNRLSAAGGERFHYDDRDHIWRRELASGATDYRRDALDQLIEIRAPDVAFHAKYDPLGRRTEKTVNGATTTYYWDSDRLAAELFPSGSVRVYVYASDLALVPVLFVDYASLDADAETGFVCYVVSNHLGAVEMVLNDAGETVWRAKLDPYGLAHVETGRRFHQPLRFPGHFFDAETGLHYNRFRYYDPKLGRYLESDPIGVDGGVNLYAYTSNPLREVDLRGLAAKCPNGVDCPKTKKGEQEDPRGAEGTDSANATGAKPLVHGVSASHMALASSPGSSHDQVQARKLIAKRFYKQQGEMTASQARSHMRGIDFERPLTIGPPPPCPNLQHQWQPRGGRQGQYYGDPGVPPGAFGIHDKGVTNGPTGWGSGPVEPKVAKPYRIPPDTPYMQSTAAPVKDTWSVPGTSHRTPGGATQRYVPRGPLVDAPNE